MRRGSFIAAPTPRTSRYRQRLATMRWDPLHSLVAVHSDGIRLRIEGDTCSFRIAALQVVCSLAFIQFLVNDFHEFID